METIAKNNTHALLIDKIGTEYWIELVNRATGQVQIMKAKRKDTRKK